MPAQPDYYEILQIQPAAEPEVIQAAYRRLSLKYHPDVYHGSDAQQRMAILNQAYAVIGDAQKRAAYDRQRFGGRRPASAVKTGPVLQVTPLELELGTMAPHRTHTASIRVSNAGQGQLSGMILNHVAWLQGKRPGHRPALPTNTTGEFRSARAVEVYSNGGRAIVAARGRVQGAAEPAATSREPSFTPETSVPKTGPVTKRALTQLAKTPLSKVRVPFMVWVALGTVVSLGVWLTWEHFRGRLRPVARDRSARQEPQQEVARLARCLECSTSFNPSKAHKCSRCGVSICTTCGACACRGPGARTQGQQ